MIGEGARPAVLAGIRKIVSGKTGIQKVNELLTMHLGPQDVLLTISLDFDDQMSAGQVERVISEMESEIKATYPEVTRVFIEAQSWPAHLRNAATAQGADEPEPMESERGE